MQPGAPRPARSHRARNADRARGPHLRPAHRARPDQGRAEHLPRGRRRRVQRDGVRDREALRRRGRARARQRRDPSAPRASGPHRLADRPLQPPRLLRAAAAVAAGVEPHAQRRWRCSCSTSTTSSTSTTCTATASATSCCASSPRRLRAIVRPEDVVCRLGGEEFGVIMDGCGRRGCGARGRARAEPAGGGRLPGYRPDDRLGRPRPRARARDEPARAGGLRGGRDDDREGRRARTRSSSTTRQGSERPDAPGDRARRALDRAPEDAAEPEREAQPAERRARDRRRDRGRAPLADRLPQLPRLRRRRRRAHPGRVPRRVSPSRRSRSLELLRKRVGEGVTGRCAERGESIVIADAANCEFGQRSRAPSRSRSRSSRCRCATAAASSA